MEDKEKLGICLNALKAIKTRIACTEDYINGTMTDIETAVENALRMVGEEGSYEECDDKRSFSIHQKT